MLVEPVVVVVVPVGQAVADVAPVVLTYDPTGAVRHDVWPLDGWYVPSAQRVAEIAPVEATNDPAGALRHEIWPLDGWNVPARQGVAEVAPVVATNDPGGAGMHGWLPVEENEPGAQGVLASAGVAPVASPNAKANPTTTSVRVKSARQRAAPNLTFELYGTIPTPLSIDVPPRAPHAEDDHMVTTPQRQRQPICGRS